MKIIECEKMDILNSHVTFIRVEPEDLSKAIEDILHVLSDLSWIADFDQEYIRMSFEKRAKDTATYLAGSLKMEKKDKVTSNTGEYIVSEMAKEAIASRLKYKDIPLAELFKEQVIGNPGFDYYSLNGNNIIIFGEAKYLADQNAYGNGMKQVARFIKEKQDISDLNDIDKFFEPSSLSNASKGEKAYSIAFSSKKTPSKNIISGILQNKYYNELVTHKEIIYVAVNV
ncbi:hypothetical protein [Anaerocolumna xylanovorans]|uniref:Anti-bacteriophage protein A/HamA C-terminal domain-containing protein n=1 Tax=Anaerocolumna xylanovorans DSM 12503 TaxID=1121345 RepID=A0A1M7Y8G6_9FIRM|nr:hypothetical protein [Anaerocolumna xylanovorans]SHO48934.1 hypothetical protein SAMN02745217_02103 [Anaerocolumna xylanovorans DSM 12503]